MTALASRHNQLYTKMGYFSSQQDTYLNAIGSLCARELLLEEWRAIAAEFVNASKCYFRTVHGDSNPVKFNFSQHQEAVPLEVGAAKIFNLHHTPQSLANGCSSDPVVSVPQIGTFNRSCIASMASVNLNTQVNITAFTSAQFSSINVTQLYGLPPVDSYVTALGKSFSYSNAISPNILLGLHKSAANYAINFGLIESILTEQQSVRDATTACMRHSVMYPTSYDVQMGNYMPSGALALTRVSTLQGLIDILADGGFGDGPSAPRSELFYDTGACT
jgi:hypothetical protein